MTRVTIDSNVQRVLLNFTKPLELCDESGLTLGKLIPIKPELAEGDWIDLTPDVTDEELEREIESGEFCSTEELIAEIKKMRGM
jgi:hypothetical protein